jgi:hypothetical protein
MSNINIELNDIITLINGLEVAINRKAFTKEEVNKYFPVWNHVTSLLEKQKRQSIVDELYKEVPMVQEPSQEPPLSINVP